MATRLALVLAGTVALIGALAVFGIMRCYRANIRFGEAKIARVTNEFLALRPVTGVTINSVSENWKPGLTPTDGSASAGGNYSTASSYTDIRDHYDKVATARGWRVVRDRPVRDRGRDFGGRVREYRKEDLCASLQYAGTRANYGWSYAFDVTWGGPDDCR